jgi:3-oxoacyl-(acyl-carrier-protein) synthase
LRLSRSWLSGSILKSYQGTANIGEAIIQSQCIGIEAISAWAPAFGDGEAIWKALIDPTFRVPRSSASFSWEELTERAIIEIVRTGASIPRETTGLILGTTKGAIQRQVEWMRRADEPVPDESLAPPPTLNEEAMKIARHARLHGPSWAVSTACSSGLVAIIEAAMCVLDGEAECMIALGADVCEPEGFIAHGFHALKAISPTLCRPFDRDRDGLRLGSAAAGCLISPAGRGESLCEISGWGISNDAVHMTAPDREGRGLIRAINTALKMAALTPNDIDVVLAHGTGTRYNDAMEAMAMREIFLNTGASPAVTALKGLFGHTLGASGTLEAVIAVRMLLAQIVPPVVHLQTPEWSYIDFVLTPRSMRIRHVLKIASGFGGMNAAIIFSQPTS